MFCSPCTPAFSPAAFPLLSQSRERFLFCCVLPFQALFSWQMKSAPPLPVFVTAAAPLTATEPHPGAGGEAGVSICVWVGTCCRPHHIWGTSALSAALQLISPRNKQPRKLASAGLASLASDLLVQSWPPSHAKSRSTSSPCSILPVCSACPFRWGCASQQLGSSSQPHPCLPAWLKEQQ